MTIDGAFDRYQKTINADFDQVRLARERRDIFKSAFTGQSDVTEAFGSGSLARSTQLKPIHDVDLIVVYRPEAHPDWGQPGDSAENALLHTQAQVTSLFSVNGGTVAQLVRQARVAGRNRAVKCFIDPPDQDDAFTVDAMPALRQPDGTLLLPSVRNRRWDVADPEFLIGAVKDKQAEWSHFRSMVRVLKDWRLDQGIKIKSLVIEVLALDYLPTDQTRPTAVRDFFVRAAQEVLYNAPQDPAKHCGPIQPDLDLWAFATALGEAGNHADLACKLAAGGDTDSAKHEWRKVFGSDFPAPPSVSAAPGAAAVAVPRRVRDAPQG